MEAILFALALIILMVAGAGLTLLLKPARGFHVAEFGGLSFLLGSGFVTLLTFVAGFALAGLPLRLTVAVAAIGLGVCGWRRQQHDTQWLNRESLMPSFAGVLLGIEILIVTWASLRLALGFDGIFIWESKARIIFGASGAVPGWLVQAPPAQYPQPNYPLLLPLVESWFYSWMGSPNQGFVKLVSPLFYAAITFLLLAAGRRVAGNKWRAALPALLFFFLPWAVLRTTAGEADIPVAAYYAASCIYLLEFVSHGEKRILILSGVLAALLPWVKQEGVILWMVLLALTLLISLGRRDVRSAFRFALPGLIWIISWRAFLYVQDATFQPVFLPVSIETIRTNVVRVPTITRFVFNEMLDWKHWSVMWIIPLAGLVQYAIRREILTLIWIAMLIAPVTLYASIYIFTAWQPFEDHITSSLARLMLHLAPLTLLGIAFMQASRHEVSLAEPARDAD